MSENTKTLADEIYKSITFNVTNLKTRLKTTIQSNAISLDSHINTKYHSLDSDSKASAYNRPTKSLEALSTSIYDPWWRREHWRYEIWENFWSKGSLYTLFFRMAPGFWTFYLSSFVLIGLSEYFL